MPERMVGMMNGDDATLFIVAALHIEIDGSGYGGIARILGNLLFTTSTPVRTLSRVLRVTELNTRRTKESRTRITKTTPMPKPVINHTVDQLVSNNIISLTFKV